MTSPATNLLSVDQTLAALPVRKSRRWLIEFLNKNPFDRLGAPYFLLLGRTKVITRDGLERLLTDLAPQGVISQAAKDAHELLPTFDKKSGVVYFVQAGEFIKIGHSKKWPGRLSGLQTASPSRLTVLYVTPGAVAKEKALHRKFSRYRAHGEWFRASRELISYIEMLKGDRA